MVNIILKEKNSKIVMMDSAAHMDKNQNGNVIICGSHSGESAAKHMLKFSPVATIFNDAGKGKENAGIKGLELFEKAGIPAATVDTFSARIGDGTDTYESGIISAVNDLAIKCGVKEGMTAKEAALRFKSKLMENDN